MKAIKLRINHNYFLWVVNFYNHDGSTSRFQKIIGKLRKSISPNEWKIICIIGDFNTDINEDNNNFKLIKSLSKQMGLKVWNPNGVTRKTKRLDYLIAGEHISSSRHNILPSPSDHKAILWDIQLQSIKPPSPISIPSKEWAIKATETAMLNPKTIDSQSFLKGIDILRTNIPGLMKTLNGRYKRNDDLLKILQVLDDSANIEDVINNYWKQLWREVESQRFGINSGVA